VIARLDEILRRKVTAAPARMQLGWDSKMYMLLPRRCRSYVPAFTPEIVDTPMLYAFHRTSAYALG
jgi:hypothetical protein